jgi:signal transduction histidine kinase
LVTGDGSLVARARAVLPAGGTLDDRTWWLRHALVQGLLVLQAPVLAAVAVVRDVSAVQALVVLAPVPAGLAVARRLRDRRVAGAGVAAALMLCSVALVALSGGAAEALYSAFVLLVFVALYQDWWPSLAAVAVLAAFAVAGTVPVGLVVFALLLTVAVAALWKFAEVEHERFRLHSERLRDRERAVVGQLRDTERLKNELVGIVSHEFRTPLTSILGYARTLSARIGDFDQAGALQCAERIEREARRLSRLVHNLLAASGDVRLEPGLSSDLHEVFDDVVDTLAVPPLGLNARIPHGLRVAVSVDAAHQILANLLDNALKFADDDTPVQIRGRATGAEAILEVANLGPLIPLDARERIFQPFVQLDSSDTRGFEGIGLGLSIVRKLVASAGGTVQVRSDGRLIVFRVTLPLPVPAAAPLGVHGAVAS